MELSDIVSRKFDGRLCIVVVLAVAVIIIGAYWFLYGGSEKPPVYEWQCSQCQHLFYHDVIDAASDRPVIECPKCKTVSAERIMHFQCRMCWKKFDLPGRQATRWSTSIACPDCGSRMVRDLDNPVPGDDRPVEGGQPNPENSK
jgi:putative FmdB family regulatory protein